MLLFGLRSNRLLCNLYSIFQYFTLTSGFNPALTIVTLEARTQGLNLLN